MDKVPLQNSKNTILSFRMRLEPRGFGFDHLKAPLRLENMQYMLKDMYNSTVMLGPCRNSN